MLFGIPPPPDYNEVMRRLLSWSMPLPRGSMSIPFGHVRGGILGGVVPCRGMHQNGRQERDLLAILKDEQRAYRQIGECGAITTWDGLLAARAAGKADNPVFHKQTTAGGGSFDVITTNLAGNPPSASITNVPGGAVMNSNSVGALPLVLPSGSDRKCIVGLVSTSIPAVASGGQFMLLVDLLVAAGNISTNSTAATTVNTTALTRYTDGVGVVAALQYTAAPAANYNVTVVYTGTINGANQTTGALWTGQYSSHRRYDTMVPLAHAFDSINSINGGWALPLAAGDTGVTQVQTVQYATASASGVVAALLHKPLMIFEPWSYCCSAYAIESSTPSSLMGLIDLPVGSDGALGFLAFIGTPAGPITVQVQTCSG